MNSSFKKLNNIVGWIVFGIAAFTYLSTIERTASFWDCGEFIACTHKLEVGHPPGAPTFMLFGKIFTLFAGNDVTKVAMMVNAMSALASAFTILFLFWTISRLAFKIVSKNNREYELSMAETIAILGASAVGALAYTFSDSFWFSAVEGEVYASSSLFTALVFWAILKWEEEDDTDSTSAWRWIVLISYLIGLSIGVHLLNLLVIPAIVYVYYFKKYKFSWKSFFIAGIVGIILLGFVQSILIPKIVKLLADSEVFAVNKLGLPFNSGIVLFFLFLVSSIVLFIMYSVTNNKKYYQYGFYFLIAFAILSTFSGLSGTGILLRMITFGLLIYGIQKLKNNLLAFNITMMSLAALLIGYSTFFVIVIRSQSNPPMDENDPENAPNVLSYLLREQYGDWPIVYGQYYNAPTKPSNYYKDIDPIFAKDEKTGKYKMVNDGKKAIPTYEEGFCTIFPRMWSSREDHVAGYKYWGNVSRNHKIISKMNENGEVENIEVPTFGANMTFFFRYQLGYMYFRYFLWNFMGRQNDVQGLTGNPLEGNAISGISFIDDLLLGGDGYSQLKTYALQNNKGHNELYALPLLLGLLGMFYNFKKNKPILWIVFLFFFFTGIAINIYLNVQPYQPRERDYAYAGSFYVFSIWIGMGVLFLYELLNEYLKPQTSSVLATIVSLIVPGIMAAEEWDDHDRSKRTLARDCAIDYLESCEKNGILFTNGDNDTFPLWYAQEVEGIRTDVRVCNLSLFQTDWYINQMRRKAYESDPMPLTMSPEKYAYSNRDVVYLIEQTKNEMNLKDVIDFVASDDPQNKFPIGNGKYLDYIPTKSYYIDVDSIQVIKNKVVPEKDYPKIEKRISFRLGRNYITKNDLMVLDLVAHNDWSRPIYFAVTTGSEAYVGLQNYFQLEGLAYRFVPIQQTPEDRMSGGRVNTERMYNIVMNKYQWGGMDKDGVYLDENCLRMAGNIRMQVTILANALIREGKKDKAKNVLDYMMSKIKEENVPYDPSVFTIAACYYQIGDTTTANKLSKKLFHIMEHDLQVYNSYKMMDQIAFTREMRQCKDIMQRLASLTMQFNQKQLSDDFVNRLSKYLTKEDLMEEQQGESEK
jgi:hypothetical protein